MADDLAEAEAEKQAQIEQMWQDYETCCIKIGHGKARWGPGWDGLWGRPEHLDHPLEKLAKES